MRRRRVLSAEEARLWGEVVATARPLAGKAPVPAPAPPAAEPKAEAPAPSPVSGGPAPAHGKVEAASRSSAPRPPAFHPIERPVRRRIGRGRIPLDARIDLHGLTEATAHAALLGFLRRARGEGARHVLVITGRGASFGSQGVLRRALPHWLATPDFRGLVAGFEPAERAHGGDGAFYMRLRR